MNSRFSDRVKRVMRLVREEAARLGNNHISSEHLLLGIIREGKGSAVNVMLNLGLNLDKIKQSIDDYVAYSGGSMTMGDVPFTPRAKQILEIAAAEAKEMKSQYCPDLPSACGAGEGQGNDRRADSRGVWGRLQDREGGGDCCFARETDGQAGKEEKQDPLSGSLRP